MHKKRLLVALGTLAVAASAFAGTNQWTQVGQDGGWVSAVEHLPGQTSPERTFAQSKSMRLTAMWPTPA